MYLILKQTTLLSHLLVRKKNTIFHFSYILKIRNNYQKQKGGYDNNFVFTEDASKAGLMDGFGPKRTS